MKVQLYFVPPGGGEADYSLDFDMPAVPRPGDYISIRRPIKAASEFPGTCDFIVRRTWWSLDYPNNDLYQSEGEEVYGTTTNVIVECEFAIGPWSSEEHKRMVAMYEARGKGKLTFDSSCF